MDTFIKTYIIDAPWRSILFFGLLFAIVAGGLNLLVGYKNGEDYALNNWYGELTMWFLAGVFTKYVTWRAEGALERRNTRWVERRNNPPKSPEEGL